MCAVEFGLVKRFMADKNFGFLSVLGGDVKPTGEELFFHYRNGYFLRADHRNEPYFGVETGTFYKGQVRHVQVPVMGSKLVFIRCNSDQGERVAKWGYAWQYESLQRAIAHRPVYRLMQQSRTEVQSSALVIWEGHDITQLSFQYPKFLRYGTACDSLTMCSMGGGDISPRYYFEQKVGDGWKRCKDPRVFLCCLPKNLQNIVAGRETPRLRFDRHCLHGKSA